MLFKYLLPFFYIWLQRGHLGMWFFERERDTNVYDSIHMYQISALR